MPELSIIVPIYNVEKWLPRCLDSILTQTFTDFELILIDDGSPDRCGEIIEEYAKDDKRIVVVHQENSGVSAARNAGLKIAKGKYIGFVDPDDWIEKDMYQNLLTHIKNGKAELIYCNHDFVRENGKIILHDIEKCPEKMSKEQFINHMLSAEGRIGGTVWNAIFIAALIHDEFDETIEIGEDAIFVANYLKQVKNIEIIHAIFYHLFERQDSATRKDISKTALIALAKRKLMELYETQFLGDTRRKIHNLGETNFLDSCFYHMKHLKLQGGGYYETIKTEYMQYMKENFWKMIRNKEIFWKTKLLYILECLKK